MDKKSFVIFLVASSFASSTFATGFINTLTSKHSSAIPAIVKNHKKSNPSNRPYTDFSGTWNVKCGDNPAMTTVIENDADYITFDGEEFRIGQGLQGMSDASNEYTVYDHASFEWNTTGTALISKLVSVSKDNFDNTAIETNMDTYTLTMKNGQINLDGKFVMFEDIKQIGKPVSVRCVFSRKE